ncbi:hypothetical protein [Amycolatopsis solani]|uniref:hypothetical protein n=1 Tax=Amycolatopsis solani TaxID=3028615 RepID=UPI0025B1D688|nr:hypothetical protein [Amycolatopsis sp. MEP2-6]
MDDQNRTGHGADQNRTKDEQPGKAIDEVTSVAVGQQQSDPGRQRHGLVNFGQAIDRTAHTMIAKTHENPSTTTKFFAAGTGPIR